MSEAQVTGAIIPPRHLHSVRYEIRGPLARRALEMERQGLEVIKLNIGNPAAFGFRTPETMRRAVIDNLGDAEPYSHQKGIFPAREAIVAESGSMVGMSDKLLVETQFNGVGDGGIVD